jgi:NAD(P)-dependent dehydrogenase (short-subunit alcohol dehydrogenase family)
MRPTALVTGASSGIGKDIALRLQANGYRVYAAARRVGRMADIAAAGGTALMMDVTHDDQMMAAVDKIMSEAGRIDVLVNAAGYGQYGALEEVPIEDGRRQMEVNLFGLARLTQLCLPHMRKAKSGAVINISSIGGKLAFPLAGWYHASKFALEGYSDALRNEVRQFGIRVVVIEPGGIASEWSEIAMSEGERLSATGPYGRLVEAMGRINERVAPPGPAIISDLVMKALAAKRPQARYHGGYMAGTMLFLKRRLSDGMFDRLVLRSFADR